MEIYVSNPQVLPDGFVGHVLFFEDEGLVSAVCLEHAIYFSATSWEEAEIGMSRAIETYLASVISGQDRLQIRTPLSRRDAQAVSRARPFGVYRVKRMGELPATSGPRCPVYQVGVVSAETKEKAA